MTFPTDPHDPIQKATGVPAPDPVESGNLDPIVDTTEATAITPTTTSSSSTPTTVTSTSPAPHQEAEDDEGGTAKKAALLAGAAALANKVRQEAPKKVQELREKRVAGRCVILTEADGRALAIGPYKNDETARQDMFKVGGEPRVVELVSETAFFAPHEPSRP